MAIKCYSNNSKLTWTYTQGHETQIWKCPIVQEQKKQQVISLSFLSWFSQPVHSAFVGSESDASDAHDSCPAAELKPRSKMNRLPPSTNKHYLNFKTSRGQGEFIIVSHSNEVGKGTGRPPFKIFHWVILYLQPCVEMQRLRQQTYFYSLLITLWTTPHDIVHSESENKYRLISCNLSAGMFFFFFSFLFWWPECFTMRLKHWNNMWLDRFACNLD